MTSSVRSLTNRKKEEKKTNQINHSMIRTIFFSLSSFIRIFLIEDYDKIAISIFYSWYSCSWIQSWRKRTRLSNRYSDCVSCCDQCSFLANFDENTVSKLPSTIFQGVYYGWAKLHTKSAHNEVYKMVTSVGTNPYYHGEKKSMVSRNFF